MTHEKEKDRIINIYGIKEGKGKKMNDYKAYGKIKIGHKKLSERVEKTLEQMSSNPTASISRACGDPNQAKAVY